MARRRTRLIWPVVTVLVLSALQLIVADPLFSQRLLSGGCVFVLLVMLLGMRREEQVMARVTDRLVDEQPVSLLRVNAGFALVFLCINEALIASGSLMVWMSAMMVAAFLMHKAYWFTVLLVMPPEDTPA